MLGTYLRLKNRLDSAHEGQGLVEYALIIVLVSVASIAALGLLNTSIGLAFAQIEAAL